MTGDIVLGRCRSGFWGLVGICLWWVSGSLGRWASGEKEGLLTCDDLVFFVDAGNGDKFGISLRGAQHLFVWNYETRAVPGRLTFAPLSQELALED